MFIVSVSGKGIKRAAAGLAAAAVLAAVIAVSGYFVDRAHRNREINGRILDTAVRDDNDILRIARFLTGADDCSAPVHTEVTIPCSFNDIYEKYNGLQTGFGTDLHDYSGAVCNKYTVLYGDVCGGSTLTLLVHNGLLIGGDLSENAFDGTMKGLSELTGTESTE